MLTTDSSMNEKTAEAIGWLRDNLNGKHVLVCFSGGKDSICIEKLVGLAGISYTLNTTLTGMDPPEVLQFIRREYPDCTYVRPRQSFWHLITTANPPGGTGRGIKWCCTKIKENPSLTIPIENRIVGIRAEESWARKKYGRINNIKGNTHYYPIFHWNEADVWEFIETYGLKYPVLYDEGFDRIGCVVCPNHHRRHDLYRDRWPNHFKLFEKQCRKWYEKRVGQGKQMYHATVEEFIADWYEGKFYYYKHEPKQKPCSTETPLFEQEE